MSYVPNLQKKEADIDFKAFVIRSIDRTRTYTNNLETDTSSNFSIPIYPVLNGNYRVGNITICNSLYNVNSNNCTIYSLVLIILVIYHTAYTPQAIYQLLLQQRLMQSAAFQGHSQLVTQRPHIN